MKKPDNPVIGKIEQLTDKYNFGESDKWTPEYVELVREKNLNNARFDYLKSSLDQMNLMVNKLYLLLSHIADPYVLSASEDAWNRLMELDFEKDEK